MKKNPLLYESQFESKEQADAVLEMCNPYFIKSGYIAGSMISVFEILMFIRIFVKGLGSNERNMQYGICYLFLLTASIILIVLVKFWSKEPKKIGKKLYILQIHYIFIITVWACLITILDGYYHGFYDIVVYMTITLVIPIFGFVNPIVLIIIQLAGNTALFISFGIHEQTYGLIINFIVYSLISLSACVVLQRNKKNLYIKQYELQKKAIIDPLTGILNRLTLLECGEKVWNHCMENNTYVSVIMADLDFFKDINDTYGHLAGDRCIKRVAKVFEAVCDKSGYSCYRYGGEEFVLLMADADRVIALSKAEQIMNQVKKEFEKDEEGIKLTVSLGVYTGLPTQSENLEKFLSKADKLLYKSKFEGRDRYSCNE